MCGIAGQLGGRDARQLASLAKRMADALMHRGPDDSGLWTDESSLLALGHRRLAVVDLTEAGHQPMLSASGRWVLAYNGEVYNHMALRGRLEAKDQAPAWRGHSDTETLLACVEAWGVTETLRQSTGMFAIALWDREERALWLARDRIGEKPLYYGWQGDTFLFGSELKALRAHPAFNAAVDRGALALLVRHNYVPGPHSIYQGIRKLAPGTSLRIGHGQRDLQPTAYWSLAEVAEQGMAHPFRGSDHEALLALEKHLGNAVRGQMMADVPLGAMLSGGIDSTAVTALMQANSTRPVRTFTIGFDERQYDEATHARVVAKHLGTDHTELCLSGKETLALVPRMATMYDEPFADSSQLPTNMVMALARKHVTVALSGDGGDEFFGGYNRYAHGPRTWNRIRWMPRLLRRAVAAGLVALPAEAINQAFGGVTGRVGIALPGDKAHKLGMRLAKVKSADDLNVSLVSEWSEHPRLVLDAGIPSNLLDDRSRWPVLDDSVSRMMALDGLTYLPDDILVKVDRAAMAVSLETRAPFLDHALVEFAWSLPMHMKLRHGEGKWLLRRLVDRHVPAALMDRPKMGFGIPLDQWLRGPLREWGESLLSEERLVGEGFLDPKPIRATWLSHQSGKASYGYRLWSVLMFQAWLENENRPVANLDD